MTEKARAPYQRPEIVVDQDGRTHLSKITWNHDTMALHVLANGALAWITVGDLARLVWGRNSENFRKGVRRRLPAFKRHFALTHSRLLVVEYGGVRGSASALKVYDPKAAGDVQAMHRMLRDMTNRRDKMLKYYEKVTGLSGLENDDHT